jgi:hypothetical protein
MLQKIRRRDIILLSGVASLACFSLITVAILILRTQPASSSGPASSSSGPGPLPTHTVAYLDITGLRQQTLAEATARSWAEDAQLVSINAGWPEVLRIDQVGEPATWHYRFYSPGKARQLFVTVDVESRVRSVEHVARVTLPPRTIKMDAWAVDSPTALALWLDYGGSEMLRTNPGLELAAQLRTVSNNPNPIWLVIGLDKRTGDIHVVAIDANVGTVITTSPGI